MAKRIMILATNGFEQSELEKPKQNLEDAGFETVVVAPHDGDIKGWQHTDWGTPVKVDMTLDDAEEADFDALLLPGGQMNPDKLRMEAKAVQLVKDFCADHVADVRCAVIYEKPRSIVRCEYVWKQTDDWINFPWSVEPPVVAGARNRDA